MVYVPSSMKNVLSNKMPVQRSMFALQQKIWKRSYRVSIKSGYMVKTHKVWDHPSRPFNSRPVTSVGDQVGRRVFWEGPKSFEQCPIVLNYVQHIFQGGEKVCRGRSAPLVTGLLNSTNSIRSSLDRAIII